MVYYCSRDVGIAGALTTSTQAKTRNLCIGFCARFEVHPV